MYDFLGLGVSGLTKVSPETSITCFFVLNDPGVKGKLLGLRNLESSGLASLTSTLISFLVVSVVV